MKKIAKMSLVAAMAIAGMTTTASAIEGLTVSGKVYVETLANTIQKENMYNKKTESKGDRSDGGSLYTDDKYEAKTQGKGTNTTFDIDFDIKLAQKISDNLSATVIFQADSEQSTDDSTSKQNANMANAYFTYMNGGLSANLGLQDINTPNTDGEEGEGSLVTYGVTKDITLAAAYFANNSIESTSQISAYAVLGSAGPVNFELWQVNLTSAMANTTAVLGGKFGPVSVEARYAMTDYDSATKDGESIKVKVGADLGAVALRGSYFTTDKDGAAHVTDASSANTFELSQLGFKQQADVKAYHVGATLPMGKVSYLVDYVTADIAKDEATELRFRAKAKVAKSTTVMATYSIYEYDAKADFVSAAGAADLDNASSTFDKEQNSARIEVKYTF